MTASNMFQALVTAPKAAAAPKAKAAPKGAKTRTAAPAVKSAAIKFAIAQGAGRPGAGSLLQAHTQAFLMVSGLADGGAYPKAQATKVIGARAVQYHMANGNFIQTEKGLELSEKGALVFGAIRVVDPEMQKAFEQFFKDGKLNDAIGVKNALCVIPV